jgi:hypothetical protein
MKAETNVLGAVIRMILKPNVSLELARELLVEPPSSQSLYAKPIPLRNMHISAVLS